MATSDGTTGRIGIRRAGGAAVALALAAAGVVATTAAPAAAQTSTALTMARATGNAPLFDGNPTTTERLVEDDPVFGALAVSQARFDGPGGTRRATHAVLSRNDVFADSLVGSSLIDTGPLLATTTDALLDEVREELQRVLAPGATVLLLGGPAALAPRVETAVQQAGFATRRLAGDDRIETAIAIADEVRRRHPDRDEVLVARAFGPGTAAWADAVAAGGLSAASGVPIVVTRTAGVDPALAAWLARDRPGRSIVVGGPAALSEAVVAGVPNPERAAGEERTATAAALAVLGWGASSRGHRRAIVLDATEPDAWALAVAAAGLSADAGAPILTVTRDVLPETRALLGTCGAAEVDTLVIGSGRYVSGSLRERIDALDGELCGGVLRHTKELRPATSCPNLLGDLRATALERVTPYGLESYADPMFFDDVVLATDEEWSGGTPDPAASPPPEGGPMLPTTDAAGEDGGDSGGDAGGDRDDSVTGTNVQEAGVDEPDRVKTDGHVLLAVTGDEVAVLDLTDDTPRLADLLDFADERPVEVLLDGDVALVVTSGDAFRFDGFATPDRTEPAFFGRYAPRTVLHRLDVSDVDDVRTTHTLELDAAYQSLRLIDGTVRLVTSHQPSELAFVLPVDGGREASQVALAHNRDVIAAAPIEAWLTSATLRDGAGETLAAGALTTCGDVSLPPWFSGLGTVDVTTIDLDAGLTPAAGASVVAAGETVYASRDRLVLSTSRWPDWQADTVDDAVSTELHSFDISDPTAVDHVASGRVPGTLLSRYSLSQHEGHLRVATTLLPSWLNNGEEPSSGQVVVLDEVGTALTEVGSVTGLGQGEQIRGVRFAGDTGYVVTFRQTDPLYVLDLADPTAPRTAGELKVTGYSAYLHPLDPARLLGVGQEADLDGRLVGPAVSLFDVDDPANPRLSDRDVLGGYGSFLAEYEPRAFLRLAGTEDVVLPFERFDGGGEGREAGVAVYRTGDDTLTRRGFATQPEVDGWVPGVERAFLVDGALVTVSSAGLAEHDLDTLDRTTWTPFRPD